MLFCRASWGGAVLYRGNSEVGSVASLRAGQNGISLFVCAEDAGALLGFSASREGDELRLTSGKATVRLVTDAAAAWRGLSLVPLRAAPFERNGRFWVDAASAASLFQPYAGSGPDNRLRFIETSGVAPSPAIEPAPQPAPAPSPTPTPTPPAVKPEVRREPIAAAPDPRRGGILRIRWGSSAHKIRGVVDVTDGAEPSVTIEGGTVHALFASSASDVSGLAYPFENVKVSMTKGERGVELDFSSGAVRVEKMMLDSPRRLVLDFHLAPGTGIVAAKPTIRPEAPQPPAPVVIPAPTPGPAPTPAPAAPRRTGKKLVVVDPGHGGKDPGTAANGVREKDVNLAIGLELEKVLKSMGFDVVMTRRTDVYLKLQERTDIANDAGADVFVSVHVNALPSAKKTAGFEIYIMALPTDKDALDLAKIENREYVEGKGGNPEEVDAKTEMLLKILGDMQQNNKINESTGLAERLFEAGKRSGLPMRRVAQAPFFVLRGAGMPAVLLETGFVTNATEAKLLAHPGYRERIAQAMAVGVADYLK